MEKMINTFQTSVLESIDQAMKAFQEDDFDRVRKLAHKIKPSIKMLKIHEISEEVIEIERQILEQKKSKRMVYLMDHLDQVLHWVAQDMKSNKNEN